MICDVGVHGCEEATYAACRGLSIESSCSSPSSSPSLLNPSILSSFANPNPQALTHTTTSNVQPRLRSAASSGIRATSAAHLVPLTLPSSTVGMCTDGIVEYSLAGLCCCAACDCCVDCCEVCHLFWGPKSLQKLIQMVSVYVLVDRKGGMLWFIDRSGSTDGLLFLSPCFQYCCVRSLQAINLPRRFSFSRPIPCASNLGHIVSLM
ncbi:hypothetical protein BDD12DRAFT_302070 [Trichophaea hybrida]|nr:hypothetical protein BDD12DRAFT_302070 [Trichophaea hybrida]